MIDPEYLRKHYAGLSDAALMAVNRGELGEVEQALYDGETACRALSKDEMLPETVLDGPVNPRLRDVKRAALIACIAAAVGIAIPMWNLARQMLAMRSRIGTLGVIAATMVVYAFTAIVPLFCLALHRNEGDVRLSRNMRRMVLIAAAMAAILSLAAIPGWIGSFRSEGVSDSVGRPWTINDTSVALGRIADAAGILLLATLSRLAGDGESERRVAVSRLLRVSTKMAVIAGGIVAVGCVVGVAATPWAYFGQLYTCLTGLW